MKNEELPTEEELRRTFNLFLNRTIELLSQVDERKELFVFCAINAQVCLELFLKYYFFRMGKRSEILVKKNGEITNVFNEFQQILNHFFASSRIRHTSKKELEAVARLRNSIVHRAQNAEYQEDVCEFIVATLYFVHAISAQDLDEPVIEVTEAPHSVWRLEPWRRAARRFAGKICDEPGVCLHCEQSAVIPGDSLYFGPATDEDIVCVCCLSYLDAGRSASLLRCPECYDLSVYIDKLNKQSDGRFPARCVSCGLEPEAFICSECQKIGLNFCMSGPQPVCVDCETDSA